MIELVCAECVIQRAELGTLTAQQRDEAPRVKEAVSTFMGTALCVEHLVQLGTASPVDDLAPLRARRGR